MNIPEEHIGSATSKIRKESTPERGNLGILDDLNKALNDNKEIEIR